MTPQEYSDAMDRIRALASELESFDISGLISYASGIVRAEGVSSPSGFDLSLLRAARHLPAVAAYNEIRAKTAAKKQPQVTNVTAIRKRKGQP